MAVYATWRRYQQVPEVGGFDDQPFGWRQELDCVFEAKEWAEGIHKSQNNLLEAQSTIEGSDDPSQEAMGAFEKAKKNYEDITAAHKERIKALRSWWREEPWEDPKERQFQQEEEEFMRFLNSLD